MVTNSKKITLEDINRKVGSKYPLTERQFNFAQRYAEHNNGMKAVREAGFNHSTPGSQSSAAYRLLKQDRIQKAIRMIQR